GATARGTRIVRRGVRRPAAAGAGLRGEFRSSMGPIRGPGPAGGGSVSTGNVVASVHALAAGSPFRRPSGRGPIAHPSGAGRQPVHDAASGAGERRRGHGGAVLAGFPGGGDGGVSADADVPGSLLRPATGAVQRGETGDPGGADGGATGVGRGG